MTLLPIGESELSYNVHNALCALITKVAHKGKFMDVHTRTTSIKIIASFDKFYNGKISSVEFLEKLKKILN